MDFGDNNIINSESAKNAFLLGSGCIEINGSNNQINIEPTVRFKGCKIKLSGDNIVLTIGKNCKFNNLYAVFSGTKTASETAFCKNSGVIT